MSKFLRLEDFLENSAGDFEKEAVVKFLEDNNITIDDFSHIGKCDSGCDACEANNFSIWRKDIGFIERDYRFTFEPEEDNETLDFAIYRCNNCGKWSTYID